jgi:hypothetical protein
MRKSFLLLIGVLLAGGILVAQMHDNAREKEARDTIVLASDVQVGQTVLGAGEYRVVCDREHIVFTQTSSKAKFEFECKGRELPEARRTTEVHTATSPDGKKWLFKLYLRGSNIEHVFQ